MDPEQQSGLDLFLQFLQDPMMYARANAERQRGVNAVPVATPQERMPLEGHTEPVGGGPSNWSGPRGPADLMGIVERNQADSNPEVQAEVLQALQPAQQAFDQSQAQTRGIMDDRNARAAAIQALIAGLGQAAGGHQPAAAPPQGASSGGMSRIGAQAPPPAPPAPPPPVMKTPGPPPVFAPPRTPVAGPPQPQAQAPAPGPAAPRPPAPFPFMTPGGAPAPSVPAIPRNQAPAPAPQGNIIGAGFGGRPLVGTGSPQGERTMTPGPAPAPQPQPQQAAPRPQPTMQPRVMGPISSPAPVPAQPPEVFATGSVPFAEDIIGLPSELMYGAASPPAPSMRSAGPPPPMPPQVDPQSVQTSNVTAGIGEAAPPHLKEQLLAEAIRLSGLQRQAGTQGQVPK